MMGKAWAYGLNAIGGAAHQWGRGVQKFGASGMRTGAGAVAGGLYGATLGRDQGQSWYGGAMTGAMGGAMLGRYGGAGATGFARGFNRGFLPGQRAISGPTGGIQRMTMGAVSGARRMAAQGKADFRGLQRQASMAHSQIGAKLASNKSVS